MATPSTQTLHAIEIRAERAIVQELRIMTQEVLALRPSLNMEERAYADGLLLKLDRLIVSQLALPESGNAAPAYRSPPVTVTLPSHDSRAAEPEPRLSAANAA